MLGKVGNGVPAAICLQNILWSSLGNSNLSKPKEMTQEHKLNKQRALLMISQNFYRTCRDKSIAWRPLGTPDSATWVADRPGFQNLPIGKPVE